MKILVSACLLGENCKYNGGNNFNETIAQLQEKHEVFPFCPEVEGGLSTPRIPCEIIKGKVIGKDNKDYTEFFLKGAEKALEYSKEHDIHIAVFKQRSPSCGYGEIYDGSFSATVIEGMGKTAELLEKEGIEIFTEKKCGRGER